jgi:hypothetical protein
MNCEQFRQAFLDSLIEPAPAGTLPLEDHLAGCEQCRRFAAIQRSLDARLTAAVPDVSLSPAFRSSLQERLPLRQVPDWSESLPDIAHLAGCALGIVLLLLLLPQYSRAVLLAGSAFTGVTYFAQALLRGCRETLDPLN